MWRPHTTTGIFPKKTFFRHQSMASISPMALFFFSFLVFFKIHSMNIEKYGKSFYSYTFVPSYLSFFYHRFWWQTHRFKFFIGNIRYERSLRLYLIFPMLRNVPYFFFGNITMWPEYFVLVHNVYGNYSEILISTDPINIW